MTEDAYSANPLFPQFVTAWPMMGEAAFRGLPGEVVHTISPHTEAHPVALLMTFLTTFGAALGRGPHVRVGATEHPGRLFTVLVGSTSKSRKGTSWDEVHRIFVVADPDFTERRILSGFGSGEAVVDAVAEEGDDRLLVREGEWARILSVARREGSTLSPLLREAWDGGRLAVRSRAGNSVARDGAHVALLGHITMEELRARLVDIEAANGFGNRHLFPLVKRNGLLPSGGNLDYEAVERLARKTRDALASARPLGRISRTPEADTLWEHLYTVMARDEPDGLFGAVICRDQPQVLRLSLLFALTDGSAAIGLEHLEAAWAVWSYCRESAAIIWGASLGNPLADKLLRALREVGEAGLSGRDLDRAAGGHKDKADMTAALDLLHRRNLIDTHTEYTGGRPTTITVAIEYADIAEKRKKSE